MSKRQDDPAIAAVLELLAETYPKCFAILERRRRPLKVGIREDLLAALDGVVTPAELHKALRVYAGNKSYRNGLVAGAIRIGLDGQPAGAVTPEEVPPPPRNRPVKPPAVKNRPKSSLSPAGDKSEKAPLELGLPVKGPPRLGLAELRMAAQRRRETSGGAQ